jgi:hypothetical protein
MSVLGVVMLVSSLIYFMVFHEHKMGDTESLDDGIE